MNKNLIRLALLGLLFGACSSGGGNDEELLPTPEPDPEQPLPIALNCLSGNYAATSRATDYGFEKNDAIGVYVVNYKDGQPGVLQPSGNHVDNMRFTYNATWTPDPPVYWLDNRTKADFYVYYPYNATVDLHAHAVTIPADQSTGADYKKGDFLWGKTAGVAPRTEAVSVTVDHVFSQARILVKPGNGFTDESLAAATVSVRLNGIRTQATVDLANGKVAVGGDKQSVVPFLEEGAYKAIVAPQAVTVEGLVTITVDGREFNLKQDDQSPELTFEAGHRHTLTITVSKTSNSVNVDIGDWEDDGIDHGGVAE